MFWFIFGLLLGGVAGFVACSLFTMGKETDTSKDLEITVLHPDPCNHQSGDNRA